MSAPRRPRRNQPLGYMIAGALAPKYYYGGRHDYVYYPDSWTDSSTGTYYEAGYYDEDGRRYDSVAFENNGRYENVLCHCDYCGQDTVLNLDAATDAFTDLKCPNCTAPLTIKSELDKAVNDSAVGTPAYNYSTDTRAPKKKKKRKWPWVVAVLVSIMLYGYTLEDEEPAALPQNNNIQQIEVIGNDNMVIGSEILLVKRGDSSYAYAPSGSADKTLFWDEDADSYYDESSDCWLWYNTDVTPSLWQYWYEGISSDYGDYGWMEHDADGWFIETSDGNWVELPSQYDSSGLWWIDD